MGPGANNGDLTLSQQKQLSFAEAEAWEVPPIQPNTVEIGALEKPIWTETKAQLIQNYLRLFLFITKHGVYIDGFAGPQNSKNPDSWAAKLVLEMTPDWMKSFFLCDINRNSFKKLKSMVENQPGKKNRSIEYHRGDFNVWVDAVLQSGIIKDTTATFALLDQRSTECEWSTVEKLAKHKSGGNKIELFYFFPTGWIHRALNAQKDKAVLDRWWGGPGWKKFIDIRQPDSAAIAMEKVKSLGYKEVSAWPIRSRKEGEGRTMYHMIHATDHVVAPKLMYRAYRNLIGNVPAGEQLTLL